MLSRQEITRRQFHAASIASGAATILGCPIGAVAQEAPKEEPLYGNGVSLRGMPVFPANNLWNQDISKHPTDRLAQRILERIGLDKPLHPEFGGPYQGKPNGIPYVVVPGTQPRVPVRFTPLP